MVHKMRILFFHVCTFIFLHVDAVPVLQMFSTTASGTTGDIIDSVIRLAVERVSVTYGDYFKINVTVDKTGNCCSPYNNMMAIADVRYNTGLDILLGPVCETDIEIAAFMAASWNIPIIIPSLSSDRFTNKTQYPTVTNMAFTTTKLAEFYMTIFATFQWTNIVVIFENNDKYFELLAADLYTMLQKNNYTMRLLALEEGDVQFTLMEAKKHARVFVMFCNTANLHNIMSASHALHMTKGEYAFLFYMMNTEKLYRPWEIGKFEKDIQDAYESVLVIQPTIKRGKEFFKFVDDLEIRMFDLYNYTINGEEVSLSTMALYESVMLYSRIINATIAENGNIRDGRYISDKMKNRMFKSLDDEIHIDNNGDRDHNFKLLDLDIKAGNFLVVADYNGPNKTLVFRNDVQIHWPTGKRPPKNAPICGYLGDNTRCKSYEINKKALIGCLMVLALCGIIVACLVIFRRLKSEADLKSQWWNIKTEDLVFSSRLQGSTHSKFSMIMSTDDMHSLKNGGSNVINFTSENKKWAYYKGSIVSLTKTNVSRLTITRDLLKEFKQMKDIHCSNLAKFIGVHRTMKELFLVMENCTRGSLQDVLQNDSLMLDWEFKVALITDLVNGMTYLHNSPILIHGRLNSERCIIDSRFGLKISEYGLPSILGRDPMESVENEKEYLWFAPECLRGNRISQACDVYSFGIILYEILTRTSPFETELDDLTIDELMEKIKSKTGRPLRPSLPIITENKKIVDLMRECWDESFFKRPTFKVIKKQLKEITGISTGYNILDALLRRMEQYANNLEELVGQRTEAFLEEKKKSDQLLEQLLPKTVADKLKNNQVVEPESFKSVSIYFSDIVGFTVISADSTPMQVVDLLNDLYSLFDDIIGRYDVYKVETIGDAYMVVSGLPNRNGKNHVREIARMSLDILKNINKFKVRHLPGRNLQTRIGLHSGPVCAGVVGTKMPRYCLFGDTVNTASRMESHGEAMKIHISAETKTLLEGFKRFQVEKRGEVLIKGKGTRPTYWLLGEDQQHNTKDAEEGKFNEKI